MVEVGELIISIKGDVADIQTKLNQVQQRIEGTTRRASSFGDIIRRFGFELRRLSIAFTIIGGTIVFAMKKMIDSAIQVSEETASAWSELTNQIFPIMQELALTIAETIIPLIASLWQDHILPLIESFLNLSSNTKETIFTFLFWGGVLAFITGPIIRIIYLLSILGRGILQIIAFIGLPGVGLIAMLAILVLAWTGAFEEMQGPVGTLFRFVRGGLALLADIWINIVAVIVKSFRIAWEGIKLFFATGINWIISRLEDVANAFVAVANLVPGINIPKITLPKFGLEEMKANLQKAVEMPLPGFFFTRKLAEERTERGFGGPGGLFGPQPPTVINNIENNWSGIIDENTIARLTGEFARKLTDEINRSVAI